LVKQLLFSDGESPADELFDTLVEIFFLAVSSESPTQLGVNLVRCYRELLAEKLIRTIAEKCLRKGLRIKVAHCAPRKRAKNLDPRERVGKIWRWCGELFAMRVLLRSSRSLSRMSVREVLAA
jgi:hypothetical protein